MITRDHLEIGLFAALGLFLFLYLLWTHYLAVMCLARERKRLTETQIKFGALVYYTGWIMDLLANLFIFTFIFLEPPREALVTRRLIRLINGKDGWRKRVAIWFCNTLLDTFDPKGCHCTRK